MTSIKDWQDAMRAVDGWDEAADLIDKDDVKRWNADPKMDLQKFKSALNYAVKSDTMKVHLFVDNVYLKAHAESLQDKAPKQKAIVADDPGSSNETKVERPREDFDMPLSFWCNLGSVFFKGQKKHTAEATLTAHSWEVPLSVSAYPSVSAARRDRSSVRIVLLCEPLPGTAQLDKSTGRCTMV